MTVSTSTAKSGPYAGSGTTGPFTVTFRFLDNSHLTVVKRVTATGVETTLALNTDYSVSGAGAATGTVTLVAPLASGETLTITRNVPATQEADYVPGDAFPAESHELALDKLTMLTQQNAEAVGRSIKAPVSDNPVDMTMPSASARARRYLSFDESGRPVSTTFDIDAIQNASTAAINAAAAAASSEADAEAAAAIATSQAAFVSSQVAAVAPNFVQFTGDGSETDFTLPSTPGSEDNIDVWINGVYIPKADYTLSGTTLAFGTAPLLGDEIEVKIAAGVQLSYAAASAVAFTPSGAGAVTRDVQAKLRETVSVKDFGAVGDGVVDDTAAVQAACNASRAVFFPVGTYKLTAQIAVSKSTAFAIYGDGIGNSILLWTNATGGIAVTMSNNFDPVIADGVSIRTTQAGGGTGLQLTYPVSPSSIFVGSRLSNVEIRGVDNDVDYWTVGLRLVNAWNTQCSGFHIQGSNTVPRGMTKAISMTNCYDVVINACYGTRGEYGIWVGDGEDEGLNVSECVFIDFATGIYINSFEAQAGTSISNNHMNTEKFGMNLYAKQQCVISGNLIYKITGSTESYIGINMKYSNDCRVVDNYIRNTGLTGGEIGVLLDDTDNCVIMGNQFVEFNPGSVGVQVGALSGGNLISNNMTYTPGTAVVNFGAGVLKTNTSFNNFPSTVSVLTVNSAAPSVGNDVNGQWKTANTVATTITNFLDAYESQVICILADDSNTTIQHNAGLILKGAVDYVMSLGNIITLRRDATLWREVSRST